MDKLDYLRLFNFVFNFQITQYDEKYKFVKSEFKKLQEESHKNLQQVRYAADFFFIN